MFRLIYLSHQQVSFCITILFYLHVFIRTTTLTDFNYCRYKLINFFNIRFHKTDFRIRERYFNYVINVLISEIILHQIVCSKNSKGFEIE